ncbi:uncharacterized protein [Watersipora subatra]|uniref:uncharacterized protein isoform X2 n=1 Tax=Watersipora subatra TaxID=2589382 RepID=UPI00355C3601
MKPYDCITHRLVILSLLEYFTAAVSICPTRSVDASASGFIESPGYPESYDSHYNCTLTLVFPASSRIVFSVHGTYDVHEKLFGGCSNVDYLRLVSEERTVELCGEKSDKEILATFETNKQAVSMRLEFRADTFAHFVDGPHIFQINYTEATDNRATPTKPPSYRKRHRSQKTARSGRIKHFPKGDTSQVNRRSHSDLSANDRMKIFLGICGGFVVLVGLCGGLLTLCRKIKSRSETAVERDEALSRLPNTLGALEDDESYKTIPDISNDTGGTFSLESHAECTALTNLKYIHEKEDGKEKNSPSLYKNP